MWLLTCCRTNWNLRFRKNDIDRSHRSGKPSQRMKRLIIVKFGQYNDRHKAYSNKKRLKSYTIAITQSLTAYRIMQLNKT